MKKCIICVMIRNFLSQMKELFLLTFGAFIIIGLPTLAIMGIDRLCVYFLGWKKDFFASVFALGLSGVAAIAGMVMWIKENYEKAKEECE